MYQASPYNPAAAAPDAPPMAAPAPSHLSEDDRETLAAQGFPPGLIDALTRSRLAFPQRIWIADNSGSMSIHDGQRYLPDSATTNSLKCVPCNRWTELRDAVTYHAQLAGLLRATTTVRILNDPGRMAGPQISHVSTPQGASVVRNTLANARPSGATPLIEHVRQIKSELETNIRNGNWVSGTKLVLVLATDGLPTDSRGVDATFEFSNTLRDLQGLPIWIVVRLCTDDESVVQYYNEIDANLELNLDILDDFESEAKEVYQHNPWLNYALPLHRLREWGYSDPLLDALDERAMTVDELRDFLLLLFGIGHFDGVPDPQEDWKEFAIRIENIQEPAQWNPITKRMEPWVDMRKLREMYGDGSDASFCAIQ